MEICCAPGLGCPGRKPYCKNSAAWSPTTPNQRELYASAAAYDLGSEKAARPRCALAVCEGRNRRGGMEEGAPERAEGKGRRTQTRTTRQRRREGGRMRGASERQKQKGRGPKGQTPDIKSAATSCFTTGPTQPRGTSWPRGRAWSSQSAGSRRKATGT